MYEQLEHPSDIKLKVYGKNEEDLFENIAIAIEETVFEKKKNPKELEIIKLKEKTLEMLIHEFIEELLFLAYSEKKYFSVTGVYFKKENEFYYLQINLATCNNDYNNYKVEIKACSFNIKLNKTKKLSAEFILDI